MSKSTHKLDVQLDHPFVLFVLVLMLKELQTPLEGLLEFAFFTATWKGLFYPVDVLKP